MESLNLNSKERELQLTQRLIKQRHSHCMTWFEQLEIHLRDLYLNNSSHAVDAFKPAFRTFFSEEHQTFRLKMFHNLDQLRLQLDRENLHKVNARTCLEALQTQFKEFFASKGVNSLDHLNQCWQQNFKEYTLYEPGTYRHDLLENLHRAIITYGILRMKENEVISLKVNGKQLNEDLIHEHEIKKSFKLQSQDVQINPVQAVDDNLCVSKSSWIESENNNALSKLVNETQLLLGILDLMIQKKQVMKQKDLNAKLEFFKRWKILKILEDHLNEDKDSEDKLKCLKDLLISSFLFLCKT
ncbi:hypothetical protein Tco_0949794 [Tanacetum coccineum]